MPKSYLEKILLARVYDVARETPLTPARRLGQRIGNRVLLKREDLQPVFSFKLRGAFNKISLLAPAVRARGVIAASAGNHAQGVALSARHFGIPALIVMPRTTPSIKVEAVTDLGARAVLHGDTYEDASIHAHELAAREGLAYIPPYDDPDVIAGQGTIAMELLRQHPDPIAAVFVPVGGGGLIAGIAAYIKSLRPEVKVIGVEPDDAASLHASLRAGRRCTLKQVGIFADGVAVRQVGKEPFRIARRCVDEVVLVSTDEICTAIRDIFEDTRSIAEPAGALGIAGLKRYAADHGLKDANLIAIVSGANINFDRLRHVAERTELGAGREALLAVTIPERPGSFRAFCRTIGKRSITEFNYRYAGPGKAHVFAGIQLGGGPEEKAPLIARLEKRGYGVVDMSDNEIAKIHIRHMVGGHAPGLPHEALFRFEFPERPGALLRFLQGLSGRWNISLFHYRNHGDAFGRVLLGIQLPPDEHARFTAYLVELGYPHWDETDNPAYQLFAGTGPDR